MLRPLLLGALGLVALQSCDDAPRGGSWCSAKVVQTVASVDANWNQHLAGLVGKKCANCHGAGGISPVRLQSRDDFAKQLPAVRQAVASRTMPPWQAAGCCNQYAQDFSLADEELAVFLAWIDAGAPVGPPPDATPVASASLLSRVDATLHAPAYVPKPAAGKTDEVRCFVLDAPANAAGKFVTGFAPKPGVRTIVHHLIVAAIDTADAAELRKNDGSDGRAGFECAGGLGKVKSAVILGGGLQGGDFPRGIGKKLDAGQAMLVNIHYSLAGLPVGTAAPQDQTDVELRLDDTAREAKGLVVANPAWLIGDAMLVKAGDKDATYWFSYVPTLLTAGKTAYLQSVTPHLHALASKVALRILRADGSTTCLLEIPKWRFGWEQPFWMAQPVLLGPKDQLYIECHFDNSPGHQGGGRAPKDFAWGEGGQDMCAGFATWTESP